MNGILIIDKPQNWTSHDVVAKLRRLLGERRAGHAGTLDPLATGLLAVFFGRATRAVQFAEAGVKEYEAEMRFGITTDTQDITGNVLSETQPRFTEADLDRVLKNFRGEITQTPPMYSALKVGGKKLYEIARRGGEVERKPRPITVYSLERGPLSGWEVFLRVQCGKGTYIRTLCHDIGEALGCGGCMTALRRTRSGPFTLDMACTVEEVSQGVQAGKGEELLLPVESLFSGLPRVTLSEKQERRLRCGGDFSCIFPAGRCLAFSQSGAFLALAESADGRLRTVKSFFEVDT